MNHEIKTNKSKGFSLVELIVVIAIMAVMVAVLAPALLQYVERSRAQKDDSAMGEVANAIQLALSDQKIYDEVLYSTAKYNVSCYIDKDKEGDVSSLKEDIKSDGSEYRFKSDARLADENKYAFAGKMRGVTITFKPDNGGSTSSSEFKLGNGVINAALKEGTAEKKASDLSLGSVSYYGGNTYVGKKLSEMESRALGAQEEGHHYLYNRVRASVGDSITLTSQTYRNSDYTVFIRMATTGGNSAAGQDSVQVYGQWNGTNLPKTGA